jgi:IS30 family transposase
MDDRIEIQECLNRGVTFKDIARRIGKDPTTVSKEVKKHITTHPSSITLTKADGTLIKDKLCPEHLKAPFVCNPCKKKHGNCAYPKQYYNAKVAQGEYKTLLVEAREGIPLSKEAFWEANTIISDGIKKGQHLHHIMHTQDVGISKSTAYRHLHRGYLFVDKLDFPRVVKFKPRKQRWGEVIPKAVKVGRTYDDFLAFIETLELTSWVEMDTVIGSIGGKVILTFHFTICNFMFGLLLDNKTASEVTAKVSALKKRLIVGNTSFGTLFSVLLTDNGGEFSNVYAFTNDADGEVESVMFFCDPYRASQKPHVEKNHTLFRDIVPKGQSFDHFTQDTVDLIFSHVNGVVRKTLNNKTPYELFSFLFDDCSPELLGIRKIPATEVIQSPKLLKNHIKSTPLTQPYTPYDVD